MFKRWETKKVVFKIFSKSSSITQAMVVETQIIMFWGLISNHPLINPTSAV